jgi:hypothetical protein
MTYNGAKIVPVEYTETFSPESGVTQSQRWVGTETEIKAKATELSGLGWQVSRTQNEGINELTASLASVTITPGVDVPVDEWNLTMQYAEIDVWADENLRKYIHDNGLIQGSSGPVVDPSPELVEAAITTYRSTIEDHLKNYYSETHVKVAERPGPTPLINTQFKYHDGSVIPESPELTFVQTFYGQLASGATKSESSRVVMRLTRTMIGATTHWVPAGAGQVAWVRSELISVFGIPVYMSRVMPPVPPASATPPGTRWAWALRGFDSTPSASAGAPTRIVERWEWVFAPCRVFTFEFLTH